MDTNRILLTKSRKFETSLGCRVVRRSTFNPRTGCVDEEITLSHPEPISEVAFNADRVLDREVRR